MTKIGKMPYLNSEIFYLKNKENFDYVTLSPKEMGRSMKIGQIDAGPVSLVDFINSKSLKPLMNYCVSTKKYANSVFIFSRKKLGKIKSVHITDETSTSVILMKVLNQFYWKNDLLTISKEINNSDSQLLIGDKALKMKLSNNDEYEQVIDLGFEWYKFTSLPFVFALWAHNNLNKIQTEDIEDSINFGIRNYENSIRMIIENRKDNLFSPEFIRDYIKGFNYELTNLENNAITTFKEMYNKLDINS
ncbi:MAG: hypothetical protein CL762_00580 [Chloroflexi bacterium]|nr:hypothetical protein [Chloroflexota bacterium]|tara:strand:- start:452 stop:1192 length:741 start_codon:yes stop_codon:yes gene_type:complete